jgi:hypothetical protein
MSRKLSGVVALAGVCALSLFLLSCGSSSYRPAGVLYVLTQGEGGTGNFVSSFSIDLYSGDLSEINSVSDATTCPTLQNTPPVACGIPVNIVMGPGGTTAFVLNQGAPCQPASPQTNPPTCEMDPQTEVPTVSVPPTIYPYTVNLDGSLSKPGTALPLNNPLNAQDTEDDAASAIVMNRDASGQFLFVLDQGSSPSPSNSFLNGSIQNCPAPPIAGTNFTACPSISVFAMQAGSTTLTLASGSPFYLSKVPSALSTITFTPVGGSSEELLFVTNSHDLNQSEHYDNTVSVYQVSSSGVLTEQVGSPYLVAAVDPISVQAVNTNPTGEIASGGIYVYVGAQNNNAGQLYPFQICTVVNTTCTTQQDVTNNLMLPLVQPCSSPPCPTVAPTAAGSYPGQMVVDPTNNFLYVASAFSSQVFGFHMNTSAGTLSALAPAYSPTGTDPVSLVILPSVNSVGQNFNGYGQFLFVSNNGSSNITGLTLSTTDGAMGNPITVLAPAAPTGMAVQ